MRVAIVATAISLSFIGLATASDADASIKTNANIPAQRLGPALESLAKVLDLQVLYRTDVVGELMTKGASGAATPDEALTQLLEGTGLTFQYLGEKAVTIVPLSTKEDSTPLSTSGEREGGRNSGKGEVPSGKGPREEGTSSAGEEKKGFWSRFRLAQAETSSSSEGEKQTSDDSSTNPQKRITLEEIIVTAQKREERLQDVPLPVAAIDASALAQSNQVLIRDYYTRIPNLNFTPGVQSAQILSIRGITTGRGNPTVGIMVDEMPYASSSGIGGGEVVPDIDPGDLARVEVLRGPQGTLYGASSMGGLMKFVTVDPSPKGFESRLQVGGTTIEGDTGYSVRGAANIPLGDTLAMRISGFHRNDPGYIHNIQTGEENVNSARANGGRLSLLWRPSDSLSVKLAAILQEVDGDGSAESHSGLGDLQQSIIQGSGWYERSVQAYSLTVDAELGPVALTSISGYSDNAYSGSQDQSYAFGSLTQPIFGVSGVPLVNDNATEKLTQELRAVIPLGSRMELLAGGFYTREESFITQNVYAQNPAGATVGTYLHLTVPTTYSDVAAFADLTFRLTDRFDVQLGGRQSWLRQTFTQTQIDARLNQPDLVRITPRIVTEPEVFTYLLTPRFRISPDLMVYARFASGYRAGGINAGTGTPPSFDPDKTQNYELGFKGSFLDRALSVDASLYYIDWKDLQLNVRPGTFSYTTNGSRAESKGVEVAIAAHPWRDMTISATAVWNDAVLTEDFPVASRVVAFGSDGDRLPWSSRLSGSLVLNQEFPIRDFTGFIEGAYSYVGDRQGIYRPAATPLRQEFPAYSKVDLSLGLKADRWTASVYANNLLDKRALLWGGIGAVPPFGLYYIPPRSVGAQLTHTF